MMYKKGKCILIVGLLSLFVSGIDAATVTSLSDDGLPGTLRSVIASAPSSDTIDFGVSGTIFLDEVLGELVVDKELTIDGQNKITIDGGDLINICFHITNTGTADASNSVVTNITIQNFNGHDVDPGSGTESQELPAYGILVDGGAENCEVINTVIRNIHSGINQAAAGVRFDEDTGNITDNTIETIFSEDNLAGNTGAVAGISIGFHFLNGNCLNNSIYNLVSGNSSGNSGFVIGVDVWGEINGSCSNNSMYNFTSGNAGNNSGFTDGISISINGSCSNNRIYNLTTGSADNMGGLIAGIFIRSLVGTCSDNIISDLSGTQTNNSNPNAVIAIVIRSSDGFVVCNNTISSIKNIHGPSHGLLLGADGRFITNSLIFCNTISTIIGSNSDGFGITVDGGGSVGNDLLHNSIFDINGKAINILTLSDAVISLQSVFCFDGCKLTLSGLLVPMIFGSNIEGFLIQFFVSDAKNPSQTKTFIGEKIVEAGSFKVKLVPTASVTFGQSITATATALPLGSEENNNTSEVSNALAACKPTSHFCPCPEMVPDETCESCVAS